jgi:hypothetical protein
MKRWLGFGLGVALLGSLPSVGTAQVPGVPGGAAAGVPGAAPAAGLGGVNGAAPAAAPTNNLWSFLCLSAEQKAACKDRICSSQLGQLLFNQGLAAPSTFTGGVIPQCCPATSAKDLLEPADTALGAAALIQQDEANAKKRRAAVRYLGTVDCNYWPEAMDGLYNALRADRNECVRLEAALALSRGCCCNKRIIQGLTYTVSGSRADGNPAESCERVKMAAAVALSHCLSCFVEIVPAPIVKPKEPGPREEPLPEPRKEPESGQPGPGPINPEGPRTSSTGIRPIGYSRRAPEPDAQTVVQQARQALSQSQFVLANGQGAPTAPARGGLVDIIAGAFNGDRPAGQAPAGSAAGATPKPEAPAVMLPDRGPSRPASPPVSGYSSAPRKSLLEVIREKVSGPKEQPAVQPVYGTMTPLPPETPNAYPYLPTGSGYAAPAALGKPEVRMSGEPLTSPWVRAGSAEGERR